MTTNFDHLVAFVSDQAVDAVSVLCDKSFHFKRVTLLGLEPDFLAVPSIKEIIERRLGVPVETYTLPSPRIPVEYCRAVENILSALSGHLVLNLNTDNVVCACLTLQVANRVNLPFFAIESHDHLVWLSAAELSIPPHDIEDKQRCLDVFALSGFEYMPSKPVSDYASKLACAKGLLPLVIRDETLLQRWLPRTGLTPRPMTEAADLTLLLKESGLLTLNSTGRWQFINQEAIAFLRGSWLEFAVYDTIQRLANELGVVDSHRGLCVKNKDSRFICEFDVVFMLNNVLHIIECKSGDSRGAKFLTHFEGITRAHGLRARTMLVSVDRLSDTLIAAAKGLNIAQIHGSQLSELSTRLTGWIRDC